MNKIMKQATRLIKTVKQKFQAIKKQIYILRIAYKDPRTPWMAKVFIGMTVAYLLSPIDLVPDFIPVLGILDDLIIVPLLISISIRCIPQEVLEDAKQANLDHLTPAKTNWLAAGAVVLLWVVILYFAYPYGAEVWKNFKNNQHR